MAAMFHTIGFIGIDPLHIILSLPFILLAMWAHFKVKSTYASASQIGSSTGYSGVQTARRILDANGLQDVPVEETPGTLSDHYDPKQRVLRLSPEVYHGRSLASIGIAAHEAGHALQHAQNYSLMWMRNAIVPLAITGSWTSQLLFMAGMILMMIAHGPTPFAYGMILLGVIAFGVTVVFQVVNLPVEFDASSRAKLVIQELGIVRPQEMAPIQSVLGAAAMTYVAATLYAIFELLYWLYRLGLLGNNSSSRE